MLSAATAPLFAQTASGTGKDGVPATKVFNVNVPPAGHPLKRESYNPILKRDAVALEKDDASADFRRRATFKIIPVPSDKNLTAFQSLADPSRYLRGSAVTGKLTTEIITSATNSADKSDATFKLIYDADAH